jgi:heme-degrading monooxygenase HmoA
VAAEDRRGAEAVAGYLGFENLRPVQGLQTEHVLILRFDSEPNLRRWEASPERKRWLAEATEFTEHLASIQRISGLDAGSGSTDRAERAKRDRTTNGGPMILEMAVLQVKPGRASEFESAFGVAEPIIAAAAGYIAHELHRCVENPDRFLLLVRWRTLEDHTNGFRGSSDYRRWKELLHHFYDPFPEVLHYERTAGGGAVAGAPAQR